MHPRIIRLALVPFTLMILLLLARQGQAQGFLGRDQPDTTITPEVRKEVIEGVLKELNNAYVFPEVARKMEEAIRKRMEAREYDSITSAAALTKTLTEHLRAVCHDKHPQVRYSADKLPPMVRMEPTPEERVKMRERMRSRSDFGFKKLERLEGNIGYLKLNGFAPPDVAGDSAAAAMNFLADTNALLIDLHDNSGGSPAMVALLCSYFFDGEPIHLNDIYNRVENNTHQWWTLPYVAGKRYVGKEVYLLTSNRTFSAAEEFTYNLKNLKRVTVVGETTGGGAHPVTARRVNDHFAVIVPFARAINPITKTNWEGTGVKPDVETSADAALKTAHGMALQKLLEKVTDDREKEALQRLIQTVEGNEKPKDRK
jgi:hypothetical protein